MKKSQTSTVNPNCKAFWVMVFTLLTFGFQVSQVEAQHLKIGNGIHFVNGVTVNVNDADIVNQGTIRNEATGTIKLGGNWQNDGTYIGETGSVATLDGNSVQEIGGSSVTTFSNFRLSNNAGFSITNNVIVNGTLDFQHGILSTGNHLVTIGESGTIINANATAFIEGKLANTFGNAGTRQFPIGKDGKYRPLSLQFSWLTGTSIVTAEQFETALTGALPEDATLMTGSRHWTISQSGGSGLEYFVTLDATDYTPSRPVVILKQDAGIMVSCPTTAPDYTNSTALTTFSDFGLGEVCSNPADGGTLSGTQTGCGLFDPGLISGTPPSGHTGILEYKWQRSTTSDITGFSNIDNSNTANYDPDAVDTTTWFRRLARVDCKTTWTGVAISDAVKITIDETPPVAVAKTGGMVNLNPSGNYILLPADVLDTWSDEGIGIQSITMVPSTVNCADLGIKTIMVTVKDNCNNQTIVYTDITVLEGTALLLPWMNANTSAVANGTATYAPCNNEGTFRLTSNGQSTSTNDVYHFVYQQIGTVATIIARLDDVQNSGWAGVMMRESLAPNAKTVLFKTQLYNPIANVGYRTNTGQAIRYLSQSVPSIRWMKIQRNGSNFKVFTSNNGTTWQQRYSGTISMSTVFAGIFTQNTLSNRTCKAWFDHVELVNTLKSWDEFAEATITGSGDETDKVEIYPNPADEQVTILISGNEGKVSYTITDLDGRMIKQSAFTGSEMMLDISSFKPGLYVLRFEIEGEIITKRLVVM